MTSEELKWEPFIPSRLSWIQQDEQGLLYEIKSGQTIPLTASFHITLDDGTVIERKSDTTSEFLVHGLTSRGIQTVHYRRAADKTEAVWEKASETETHSIQNEGVVTSSYGFHFPSITLAAFEKTATVLFFLLLLWQVVLLDHALQGERKIAPNTDTQIDTSDEYIPDSTDPLPIRRE